RGDLPGRGPERALPRHPRGERGRDREHGHYPRPAGVHRGPRADPGDRRGSRQGHELVRQRVGLQQPDGAHGRGDGRQRAASPHRRRDGAALVRGGDRPDEGRRRAVIEGVTPQVDGGRFAAKRIRGDRVTVGMDAFCDGHDELSAALLYRHEDEEEWHEVPMEPQRNDRWTGSFVAEELGRYLVRTVAWVDHFKTWRHDLEKRLAAGQEVEQELRIGARLVEEAAGRASGADRRRLEELAAALRGAPDAGGQGGDRPGQGPRQGARPDDADGDGAPGRGGGSSSRDRRASGEERRTRSTQAGVRTATAPSRARTRVRSGTERDAAENPIGTGAAPEQVALDRELERLVARYPDRSLATWLDRELPIVVDRERARYSTWYEIFPRSASAEPGRHGTFRDVEELLPYVRDMGFDV